MPTSSGAASAEIRGSVLLSNLPADLPAIYRGIMQRFFPPNTFSRGEAADNKKSEPSGRTSSPKSERRSVKRGPDASAAYPFGSLQVIEEADNATLLVKVASREDAQKLYKRLQNVQCCGRRWKVHYAAASAVTSRPEPCLTECLLVPPAPLHVVEGALNTIPGYLTIAQAFYTSPATAESSRPKKRPREEEGEGESGKGAEAAKEGVVERVFASFCDEGSALHARAVLSGRQVGSSGVRLFVQRCQGEQA